MSTPIKVNITGNVIPPPIFSLSNTMKIVFEGLDTNSFCTHHHKMARWRASFSIVDSIGSHVTEKPPTSVAPHGGVHCNASRK